MLLSNMRAKSDDAGRASLEFLVFSVVLVIPTLFLGMSLYSITSATLATENAARNAVRIFVQSPDLSTAASQAERAAQGALANHGFRELASMERSCQPSDCLTPGAMVRIRVGVDAPLFSTDLIPGAAGLTEVRIEAEATNKVSTYAGQR